MKSASANSLLLVDDDTVALEAVHRMLSLRFPDYTVHTAENGRAGLNLYKEYQPFLVITDINMPEMGGIEMAEQIRLTSPEVSFIVLTAYSDSEYINKFNCIGFCDYLLKPLNFNELFAAVQKCIPGR